MGIQKNSKIKVAFLCSLLIEIKATKKSTFTVDLSMLSPKCDDFTYWSDILTSYELSCSLF